MRGRVFLRRTWLGGFVWGTVSSLFLVFITELGSKLPQPYSKTVKDETDNTQIISHKKSSNHSKNSWEPTKESQHACAQGALSWPSASIISQNSKSKEIKNAPLTEDNIVDNSAILSIISGLHSKTIPDKEKAFKMLMLVGSPSTKKYIANTVAEDENNFSLQNELLRTADWSGMTDSLVKIFDGKAPPDVKATAVFAAENSSLTPNERYSFDVDIAQRISEDADDTTNLAIIDYLARNNKSILFQTLQAIPVESLSPVVRSHIETIDSL